jgi:hypothetical protein
VLTSADAASGTGDSLIFLAAIPFTSSGRAQVLAGNVFQVIEGCATDDLKLDSSVNYSALFSAGNSLVPVFSSNCRTTIGKVATIDSGVGISSTTIRLVLGSSRRLLAAP